MFKIIVFFFNIIIVNFSLRLRIMMVIEKRITIDNYELGTLPT